LLGILVPLNGNTSYQWSLFHHGTLGQNQKWSWWNIYHVASEASDQSLGLEFQK
jgi:hypothetical protein